jgi:SAM-dependent methyltransferase
MKDWLKRRDKEILSPYYDLINNSIDDFISKTDRRPILLEIGCGRGTDDLSKIYEKCKRIIGIDSDRLSLEENKYVNCKINSSLEEVDLPEDSVDIIISSWVFEHIERPVEVVSRIGSILKRGGCLIFITPNKDSLPGIINRFTPQFLRVFLCKVLYKRKEEDIYPPFYRLNGIKDLKKYFLDFEEKNVIMHDSIKFFGSLLPFRPLAIMWNYIIMSRFMEKFRAIIISKYVKL